MTNDTKRWLKIKKHLYSFYIAFVADLFEVTVPANHIYKLSLAIERLHKSSYDKNRLCVAMPPQHSKSSLITIAYVTWLIIHNPNLRILVVTAEKELAIGFGIKIRNLLYKLQPYIDFKVSEVKSSNTYLMFERNGELLGGEIRLTGFGGSITGHAVDVMVIDDPYKGSEDEFGPTALNKKWGEYTSLIEQRLRPDSKLILLHTRWHSEDIQGRIQANKYQRTKYDFIKLPAIATEEKDILGRKPGEPLWPEYYDLEFYQDKERIMGERKYQAIYQQQPLDLTSKFFYMDRLIFEDRFDDHVIARCRSWDIASSDDTLGDERDYTVGVRMVKTATGQYWIFDYERGQYGNDVLNVIKRTAKLDSPAYRILLETGTKGGAAGLLYDDYKKALVGYSTKQSDPSSMSKADRATPLRYAIFDGLVHVMITNDNLRQTFIDEFKAFPNGKHKDIVDAVAHGYNFLKEHDTDMVRTAGKRKRKRL